MITNIRRGEVYHFAHMDPAVLDELREIEWSAHQAAVEAAEQSEGSRIVAGLRRLLRRSPKLTPTKPAAIAVARRPRLP